MVEHLTEKLSKPKNVIDLHVTCALVTNDYIDCHKKRHNQERKQNQFTTSM